MVGRIVRLDARIRRLSKILKIQDQSFKRAEDSLLYIEYIHSALFQEISHIFQLV